MTRETAIVIAVVIGLLSIHNYLMLNIVFEMIAGKPPRAKISGFIFLASALSFALTLLAAFSIAIHFGIVNIY